MSVIEETAQVLWSAIQMGGCKEIDTVITPAEVPGKIGDWHHLNNGDANAGQLRQLFRGGAPGPFLGECAHVHLINDLALQLLAGPFRIRPAKRCGIDYAGRTMRSIGLEARRWLAMNIFGVLHTKPITVVSAGFGQSGKISVVFGLERMKGAARIFCSAFFKENIDMSCFRRPNAKMR